MPINKKEIKMTKREQNAEAGRKFGAAVNAGGIVERFFGYLVSYTVLVVVLLLVLAMPAGTENAYARALNEFQSLVAVVIFGSPALLIFLRERGVRKFRHKHGLSIYKNVREELEQMEINERVAKEHKAFVANGITGADSGKKDLDYWFGLLQKGAITQDEYNVKKSELMAG